MRRAASGATLLPIDSEHNAIFQCLAGSRAEDVSRIILTASGGPFRTASAETIAAATPAQAVAHPNWSMGAKISVDSATLMNKGLELIEAHYLFGLPSRADRHRRSIRSRSSIRWSSSSTARCWRSSAARTCASRSPTRSPGPSGWRRRRSGWTLPRIARLDFEAPDLTRFPALRLAREALEAGGAAPIVLNAANEVAVASFLAGRIRFPGHRPHRRTKRSTAAITLRRARSPTCWRSTG